jgi:hypothetical protein
MHLLVMEPSSYDVQSFSNENMTCRELEGKLWDDYFEKEMDLSKGRILAYHWKFEEILSSSCLIKVKYSRTKKSTIAGYIFIVIALGIIGSAVVSFTQALFLQQDLKFMGIDIIVALLLFGVGLLLGQK